MSNPSGEARRNRVKARWGMHGRNFTIIDLPAAFNKKVETPLISEVKRSPVTKHPTMEAFD